MFRMFGFLPPIASYVLAALVMTGTYYVQAGIAAANPEADINKVWLVGGILAFLIAFGGFQKSLELRGAAKTPRVSSSDVMQKLTPTESGTADETLETPPPYLHGPEADSPLGRVRAKSQPMESI